MTNGMKLPDIVKISTIREKETYKHLGILKADTIKKTQMKKLEKITPGEWESYSKPN